MVFGHAALGALGNRFVCRKTPLMLCVVAAFGPDWIDKPLKLFFGLPGHGIAHSLIGGLLFIALAAALFRRLRLPASWPLVVAVFWSLHLGCDLVRAPVLFWPFLGPFPVHDASTAEMAWRFYTARPLSALAWCDLALTAAAVAARLGLPAGWGQGVRPALAWRLTTRKERRFIDTKP